MIDNQLAQTSQLFVNFINASIVTATCMDSV